MKVAAVIARILLGLMFLVFGLNYFFHFFPMTPPPGDAGVLMGIFYAHGWFTFHGVLYVLAGALLLAGWYVPVGLTILGPIIVNILLFHITIAPGIAPGLVVAALELFLIWAYWPAFRNIFTSMMDPFAY